MNRSRPTVITDSPEHRSIPLDRVEMRAAADDADEVELTGYASTFEPYEMYGGPAAGGWIEQLDRKAFQKTLREKPDLMLLINHEGMPLARTKSGTLKLSVDSHGLRVSAMLDRSDPDVQRLEAKMRRGDMDEMSFAFRVRAQSWSNTTEFPDDNHALRTILEVNLHKGDVSVVNHGANPTTTAEVKQRKGGSVRTMTLKEALAIQARDRKRTLTRDEALAIAARDEKRVSRPKRVPGVTLTRAAIEAQVAGEARTLRAQKVVSDAVVARAKLLLASYKPSRPTSVPSIAPNLRAAHGQTIAMMLPPLGVLIDEQDRRRRAALLRAYPPRPRANNILKRD